MRITDLTGHWVLITGSSSGIGYAFAERLASLGASIVLVARRKDLLNKLANQLEAKYKVQTKVMAVDLTIEDEILRLKKELKDENICIRALINNAGAGQWGHFEAQSFEKYDRMIRLNVLAPCHLCHLFFEDFSRFSSSLVINVSSPAAFQPMPFMNAYGASKSFINNFSLALHKEWQPKGVFVQTLVPGPTQSEFDQIAQAYDSSLGKNRASPESVVDASIRGLQNQLPMVTTQPRLKLQRVWASLAPLQHVLAKLADMFKPPSKVN